MWVLAVDIKFTDTDPGFKQLKKKLKGISNAYVTIGVHQSAGKYTQGNNPPDVAEVALWNEYGTKNTPERSFIRGAIDENASKINEWRDEVVYKVLQGEITVKKALETIGFRIQVLIQNKIKSNVPPPNAPSTAAHKKREGVGQTTLIETGLLLRSISYEVHVD